MTRRTIGGLLLVSATLLGCHPQNQGGRNAGDAASGDPLAGDALDDSDAASAADPATLARARAMTRRRQWLV